MWVVAISAVAAATPALTSAGVAAYQKHQGDKAAKSAKADIDAASQAAMRAGEMTPEEQAQYQQSFGIGDFLKQAYGYQIGMTEAPPGYLSPEQQYFRQTGPLGQKLYETAALDVQDPYRTYESNLQPQLKAAQDYINTQMQKRGLLQSGLNIEQMGRAGVDLAIQEADKRMQYRADALARGAGMADVVSGTQSANLANLTNLYNTQQGYGQTAFSRQAGQALGVLPTQTYAPQAQLGYAMRQQADAQKQYGQAISSLGDVLSQGLSSATTGKSFFA